MRGTMKGNGKAPASEGNGKLGSSEGNRRPTARLDHEELLVRRGRRTGMYVIVAVHSTLLGPALGGARLWCYGTPGDAVADVLRLSEAMTLKASAAGLDLGGGKAVMCADGEVAAERRTWP